MKGVFRKVFCLGILVACSGNLNAQKNDSIPIQELDEVVVSDSRFAIKRENSGKTIVQITAETLKNYPGKSVAAILNEVGGIEINGSRSRPGEVLGVFTRGGRGRQVLIILDGVRISDPSSFSQEYDLRYLTTNQIESIEIIKGASSTLYGTNAATAVISIITKKSAKKAFTGEFQSVAGTNQTSSDQDYQFDEFSNSARINGSIEQFHYALSFDNQYAGGMSSLITEGDEKDIFSRTSTDLRIGYRLNEKAEITLFGSDIHLRNDYDESFGFTDAPYSFESRQKRTGLNSKAAYKGGDLNLNLAYTDYTSENFSAFPNMFEGNNLIMELFNRYTFGNQLSLLNGLSYSKDRTQFETTKEFTLIDPYLNAVWISKSGLNLNAGLRLSNHSEYGENWVYNFNPSYTVKTKEGYLKAMGAYSTAFIAPSLTQLFGQFGANPELAPETNRTLEFGVEYLQEGGLRTNLLYFNRSEENTVLFNNSTFQYFNAETEVEVQGVEFELQWKFLPEWDLRTNYTFTERKGDVAIRIPKHKVNVNMGYQLNKRTFASVNYSFTGMRRDTDFNTFTTIDLDAFSLFGFYFAHDILPEKAKIFITAENIFNTAFAEVVGFNTRGRNISLGINLRLP